MIDLLQRNAAPAEAQPETETLDPRVLSSVLVNMKMAAAEESNRERDPDSRLLDLMHSEPVRALLDAAAVFARRQSLSPQDALLQIVQSLQEADRLWSQVLLKEGIARLSSQYH